MVASVFLSCEHGGNRVPGPLRALFRERERLLASHRGSDIGALAAGRLLASELAAPLFFSVVSRLVVDLNRSLDSPGLHYAPILALPDAKRAAIVREHYAPYRRSVAAHTARAARRGTAVHLSIHSFTPVFRGELRDCDIGVLFDPARTPEARFARELVRALRRALPELRVRPNQPYKGTADGHTTALRRLYAASRYVGVELEFNQRLLKRWLKRDRLAEPMGAVAGAIRTALAD
jgi:predicted N-formylglutamate amidohydrolase